MAEKKNNDKKIIRKELVIVVLGLLAFFGVAIFGILRVTNTENPKPSQVEINLNIIDETPAKDDLVMAIKPTDIELFKIDVKKLVDEKWYQRSDDFTGKVQAIIAVTAIFFTVLIVVVSLFQYLKTKQFDEAFNNLKEENEEMSKSINKQKEKNEEMSKSINKQKEEIMNNNIKLMYMSEANILNQEAMKDNDIKKYDDAIKKLDDIENIDWKNEIDTLEYKIKLYKSFNYYNRANLKYNMGKQEEALADYDKSIELDLNYTNAYYNRAILKEDMGKQEEALADYDKSIELNLKNADAYFNRANLKYNMGKQEEALADYDKFIELDSKDAEAYCNRAYVKIELNPPDFKGAIEDLEIVFKLDSNSENNYHSMAEILFRQDKFKKTIKNKSEVFEYLDIATKTAENENNEGLLNECETLKNEINEYYK